MSFATTLERRRTFGASQVGSAGNSKPRDRRPLTISASLDAGLTRRMLSVNSCPSGAAACRRLIEEFQAFVILQTGALVLGRDDTHHLAGWDPIEFVARPDPELFRERFGDRHFKLAGHSGHNPYSRNVGWVRHAVYVATHQSARTAGLLYKCTPRCRPAADGLVGYAANSAANPPYI